MTLQQLEYFNVMSQTLHYTKSAQILHISQPSLSYALSQLEKELGCPLFKKDGKRIHLTKFGESFKITVSKTLLELNAGLVQLDKLINNTKQEINLGYIQSLSAKFIPSVIEQFYAYQCSESTPFRFFPNQHGDLTEELKAGLLDVVIGGKSDPDLACEKIFDQELVLVVPKNHPFAAMDSVTMERLSNEPMIMLKKSTSLYSTVKDMFIEKDLILNVCREAYDYAAAINYVSLGKGISLLPAVENIHRQNVICVRIRDINCSRPIYMLWDKEKTDNPLKLEFVEFVKGIYVRGGRQIFVSRGGEFTEGVRD